MRKKLELKRQVLRDLEPRELKEVAGGVVWTPYIKTLPPDQCIVVPTAGGECIPA